MIFEFLDNGPTWWHGIQIGGCFVIRNWVLEAEPSLQHQRSDIFYPQNTEERM